MRRNLFAVAAAVVVSAPPAIVLAQLETSTPEPLVGARSLALSPDGSRIAFNYRGDIWVAPSQGGRAVPVTTHVELDDNPLWSPDGQWIAFSSNRAGSTDVYVVPADGGRTMRITYHPGSEVPADWTANGQEILIRAQRDTIENGIFAVNVRTLMLRQLFVDNMTIGNPRIDRSGKMVLYTRFGFPWTRPRYQGSSALQLWAFDTETGQRRVIRSTGFQHLWSDFGPDGNVYGVTATDLTPSSHPIGANPGRNVDTADRTPNVYEIGMNGRARRMTDFVGGGVRFLTVADTAGLMAFEYEGHVYTMQKGQAPKKVELTAVVDDKFSSEERLVLTNGGAEDASLSPDGKTFAIVVRSELWTVPVEQGRGPNASDMTQLTTWAGLDRNPIYAPDGKRVFYTSDQGGSEQLYVMDVESRKSTLVSKPDNDVLEVHLTPDKKYVSYWLSGRQGGLFRVPVDGTTPELVFSYPRQFRWEADTSYSWSPDGRYVAYAKRAPGPNVNIFVYDTTEKKEYNVTRLASFHGQPRFSADGKYLYFTADRGQPGIYLIPLAPEGASSDDLQMKYEKKDNPSVVIDFNDIDTRIRRFTGESGGGNFRSDPKDGALYFLVDGQIARASYSGDEVRRITAGDPIGAFEFSQDGDRLVFVAAGVPRILNLRTPNFAVQSVSYRGEWVRDLMAERKAAFWQFWREYNRGFYDPNFHGRDWVAIRERYEPLLPSVGHRNEFATLLNMMVGELEASHAEVGPAPGNPGTTPTASLGVTFDYAWQGPGIRVDKVPARTPGSFSDTRINPGEYIMAINGRDVRLNEELWSEVLVGQANRVVTLLVNSTPTKAGAREVKFQALSGGEFSGIIYRNEVEARRKYVEEKSNGQLTYLHIAGMGGNNLRTFNLEAWEFITGKKGVIIDVRWNGGGNISDSLVDLIEREPNYIWLLRDATPQTAPDNSWNLPTAVLHAQTSLSNAEMFPYSMKQRGLGTTIGMRTPGYVIGTYGLTLVDGTSARMPTWGVYRMDGAPMENNGIEPMIEVDWTADQYLKGEDPQLDRAIAELMRKIRD